MEQEGRSTEASRVEKRKYVPSNERKIPAAHSKAAANEMYVKHSTHISIYIKRAHKLFKEGAKAVIIHGLTASIPKCISIALHLQEYYSDITYDVQTDSANTLVATATAGNLEEEEEEDNIALKQRSAVHITLKKHLPF